MKALHYDNELRSDRDSWRFVWACSRSALRSGMMLPTTESLFSSNMMENPTIGLGPLSFDSFQPDLQSGYPLQNHSNNALTFNNEIPLTINNDNVLTINSDNLWTNLDLVGNNSNSVPRSYASSLPLTQRPLKKGKTRTSYGSYNSYDQRSPSKNSIKAEQRDLREALSGVSLTDCYKKGVALIVCNKYLNKVGDFITTMQNDAGTQFDPEFVRAFFKRVIVNMRTKLAASNAQEVMSYLAALNPRIRNWAFSSEYAYPAFDSTVNWGKPGSQPIYSDSFTSSCLFEGWDRSVGLLFQSQEQKVALQGNSEGRKFWRNKDRKYCPSEYIPSENKCLMPPTLKPELPPFTVDKLETTWPAMVKELLHDLSTAHSPNSKISTRTCTEKKAEYTKLVQARKNLSGLVSGGLFLLQSFFTACHEECNKLDNSVSPSRWKAVIQKNLSQNFQSVLAFLPPTPGLSDAATELNSNDIFDKEFHIAIAEVIYDGIRNASKNGKVSVQNLRNALKSLDAKLDEWKISNGMSYQEELNDLLDKTESSTEVVHDVLSDQRLVPIYYFAGDDSVVIKPCSVREFKHSGSKLDLSCIFRVESPSASNGDASDDEGDDDDNVSADDWSSSHSRQSSFSTGI